jgi:hypothetical protein
MRAHWCAGECSADELERMMGIVANPRAYKIPDWFLNRQKDFKTGRFSQASAQPSAVHARAHLLHVWRPHGPSRHSCHRAWPDAIQAVTPYSFVACLHQRATANRQQNQHTCRRLHMRKGCMCMALSQAAQLTRALLAQRLCNLHMLLA